MNTKLLNLRHLRAFREVARSRSVSQAAVLVHLSQPAITQAIARLEEQLQVPLFHRRSDGMAPTEFGDMFLDRVERALVLIQNGAREAIRLGSRKGSRGFTNFDQLLTTAQLRALVAVSRAGNFSLAARAVGLSQPTLHRAARDLERLSGLTLFEKESQGIKLTPSAKVLNQAVKLAFAELEQGYTELGEVQGVDRGRIVVGSLPLVRTFVLPTAINTLMRERPDVCVSVVDGPYSDLLHDLRHGDVDVLIGALREPVPIEDVEQELLFTDPLAVVGRSGHPLAGKKKVGAEDLAAFPWVVPRAGTPTRDFFESMFDGAQVPTRIIESSSLVLIRGLLMDSDFLTLISVHQILHERKMELLAPLPFDLSQSPRPIGTTVRKDWRPTASQKRFLECLRDAARLGSAT